MSHDRIIYRYYECTFGMSTFVMEKYFFDIVKIMSLGIDMIFDGVKALFITFRHRHSRKFKIYYFRKFLKINDCKNFKFWGVKL